jgi:Flp pilus assembly pilin Flp
MKKRVMNQRGQGMTEYILIIALIAVAVIVAVKMFSGSLSGGFTSAAGAISTNTGATGAVGNIAGAAGGGH